MSSSGVPSNAPAWCDCALGTSSRIPADGSITRQELEAEEERLWKEQIEAAKSRAGAAGENYRRDREVQYSLPWDCLDWCSSLLLLMLMAFRRLSHDITCDRTKQAQAAVAEHIMPVHLGICGGWVAHPSVVRSALARPVLCSSERPRLLLRSANLALI